MAVLGRTVLCVLAVCQINMAQQEHFLKTWNGTNDLETINATIANGSITKVILCGRLGISPHELVYVKDPKGAYESKFPWTAVLGYYYGSPSEDSNVSYEAPEVSNTSHIPYVAHWARTYSSDSPPPDGSELSWRCGGTLVSPVNIITAAHCLVGNSDYVLFVVRLGDINLDDTVDDEVTPADYEVASWTAHPNYTLTPTVNDIAIVKLKNNVIFTDEIQPICLPAEDIFRTEDYTGWFADISGWGSTEYGGPKSVKLLNGRVKIVDQEFCKEAYKDFEEAVIDSRVVCAGNNQGMDACQGDSGGPLAMIIPSVLTFYLFGVVSFALRCGDANYPGVYTRVSEFMDFILENLELE